MSHKHLKTLHKLLSAYNAELRSGPVGKSTEAEPLAADIVGLILRRIKYDVEDSAPQNT